MFATIPNPVPARMKGLNRAEICDVNFVEFVKAWDGRSDARPAADEAILEGSALDARGFRELFESQLISRHPGSAAPAGPQCADWPGPAGTSGQHPRTRPD